PTVHRNWPTSSRKKTSPSNKASYGFHCAESTTDGFVSEVWTTPSSTVPREFMPGLAGSSHCLVDPAASRATIDRDRGSGTDARSHVPATDLLYGGNPRPHSP